MKAPGVVAPSLFPCSPSLLDSARLMQPHITRCFLHNLQCQKKKKNSPSRLLLFFAFFIPLLVSFGFRVPKSNYRRTNFYFFFKSLGLCGRRWRGFTRSFILFLFFLPFSSTSSQDCSIHPSPFSTFRIFNSSSFALPLSYRMWVGGP